MNTMKISSGTVHEIPVDLQRKIADDAVVFDKWESLTPLSRNEWICWIENAKKNETRQKRIARLCSELKMNKHRPCCWPGCPHREKLQKD